MRHLAILQYYFCLFILLSSSSIDIGHCIERAEIQCGEQHISHDTWQCPKDYQNFSPQSCNGTDLSLPNTQWNGDIDLHPMSSQLNFGLVVMNHLKRDKFSSVNYRLSVKGSVEKQAWISLVNGTGTLQLNCSKYNENCNTVILYRDTTRQWASYRFQFAFFNLNEDLQEFIGDVIIDFEMYINCPPEVSSSKDSTSAGKDLDATEAIMVVGFTALALFVVGAAVVLYFRKSSRPVKKDKYTHKYKPVKKVQIEMLGMEDEEL